MFLAFASAYFLSTVLRAAPATLAEALTAELQLSSGDLGLLAGAYFLGFSLTQLPLGQALDRFGPRRVLVAMLLLAALACACFARARGLGELVISRAVIGIGVSACLMAPLTAFRLALPVHHQLRANAWMLMTGSLGMVASTLPLHWLLPLWGWRGIADAIAIGILGAIGLLLVFVPAVMPASRAADPARASVGTDDAIGYARIFTHPRFVQLIPTGLVVYGGMIAMQALWVGPWLSRVAQWSSAQTSMGLFAVNATMLVTFFAWGIALPKLARIGVDSHRLMRLGMVAPLIVLPVILALGERAGAVAWALWCVSCSVVTLSQPLVAQEFPSKVAGRALSAYNLVVFVGIFVVQWGVGTLVDRFSSRGWDPVSSFRGALFVFWCASVASYVWYLAHDRRSPRAGRVDNPSP
jgi:MFS family permease